MHAKLRGPIVMLTMWTLAPTLGLFGCERDYEPYIYPEPSQNEYRKSVGERCSGNDSCRSGLICDEWVCQYPSCEQAPDPAAWCQQRFGAELTTCLGGQCTSGRSPVGASCTQERRCVEGARCIEEHCVRSCVARADCPPGDGCVNDPSGGYCGPITGCQERPQSWCESTINLEAATAARCINDTCQLVPLAQLECAQDADCPSTHRCQAQRCATRCAQDADCGQGLRCFPLSGSNTQGVCRVR